MGSALVALGKHDQHHCLQIAACRHRVHRDVHAQAALVNVHHHTLKNHAAPYSHRVAQRSGQGCPQAVSGHCQDVPVGLARSGLQVAPCFSADIEHVAIIGDKHCRGRVALQQKPVSHRLQAWPGVVGGMAGGLGHGFYARVTAVMGCCESGKTGSLGDIQSAVDLGFSGERLEKDAGGAHGFRSAQNQQAARVKTVMKKRQQPALKVGFKVNQQIAAQQHRQLGKRRVCGHILERKNHRVAQLLANLVTQAVRLEEALQALRRDVVRNGG